MEQQSSPDELLLFFNSINEGTRTGGNGETLLAGYEESPFAVCCFDRKGILFYVNNGFSDILDSDPDILIGSSFFLHVYKKDRPLCEDILEGLQKGRKEQHCITSLTIFDINDLAGDKVIEEMQRATTIEKQLFNFIHRLKSGEKRHVEVHSGPVQYRGKELLFSVITDNTWQVELERYIIDSEIKYRPFFEQSGVGIFIVDLFTEIIEANETASRILGYAKEEMMVMSPADIDAPEYREKIAYRFEEIYQKGSAVFESVHVKKN